MISCADMARHRKRASPLYLKLRAQGPKVRVEEAPDGPLSYQVVGHDRRSLSPAHVMHVERRTLDNEAGLAKVLLGRWAPDLEAIRREGGCA